MSLRSLYSYPAREQAPKIYATRLNTNYNSIENDNQIVKNYFQNRFENLNSLNTDNRIIEKIYSLDQNTKDIFQKLSIDSNKFEKFKGTQLQHYLHQDFIKFANDTANLQKQNSKSQELNKLFESTIEFIDLGSSLNASGKFTQACLVADLCKNYYAFSKGVIQAFGDNLVLIKNAILHPLKTTGEVLTLAKNLTFSLTKTILNFLKDSPSLQEGCALYFNNNDWQSEYNKAVKFNNKIDNNLKNIILQVNDYLKNVPQDKKLENIGYFVTDAVIANYTAKKLSNFNFANFKKMNGFSKPVARLIGLSCKEGIENVNNGIKILEKYPNIMTAKDSLINAVEHSIQYSKAQKIYIDNICESIKMAAKNPCFGWLFNDKTANPFPYFFVPPHYDWPKKSLNYFTDANGVTQILDKFGNSWQKTKSGFEVICSEFGSKQFALFNNGIPPKRLTINQTKNLLGLPHSALLHFFDVQTDINRLSKKFTGLTHTIPELKGVQLSIDLEHILTFDPKALMKGKLRGFHHDFNNFIEKNAGEFIKFQNKQINQKGILKTDIFFNGKLYETKTFFPNYWSREKVIDKIFEAMKNMESEPIKQMTNNFKIIGNTVEGIRIEIIINPYGKIITAYPLIA